jgi:chromosome segregation ATPase
MAAYDQAIAERNTARNELERIETEVQQIQHRYEELTSTPMATATSHHDTEQERNRLAATLTNLLSERARWLDVHTNAEHAVQRELEQLVHELHGEVVHQEQEREQAATTEGAEEATRRRDQAQAELERHERELNKRQDA